MQVAVPLSEHNMIYLPSHMGWQKCLSQHAGALAMSFSTTVKKISADIDDFWCFTHSSPELPMQ